MAEPEPLVHALLARCGVRHGFGVRGLATGDVLRPRQVHGGEVALADAAALDREAADAVVTTTPGLRVGVVTADCVPILAASADGRAVAAIHAGWRGLAAGIVEAGVAVLAERAAGESLRAVVGPCIGPECYEVDGPVLAALEARYGTQLLEKTTEITRPGHARLDLGRLAAAALTALGVEAAGLGVCTACDARRFPSYRRDGAAAGRMLHAVAPAPGT